MDPKEQRIELISNSLHCSKEELAHFSDEQLEQMAGIIAGPIIPLTEAEKKHAQEIAERISR